MKKTIALCAALLLAATITSCGKSSEDKSSSAPTSNSSEKSDAKKSDKEEKIVVDPFDKVDYYIPTHHLSNDHENAYPTQFIIKMDASESPFGSHMTFTYFIESADENEIIIKARANIDEIQDFLDEYNYTVEETEKTFSIKTSDLKTQLISTELISDDNREKIIEKMKEGIKFNEAIGDEIIEYTLEKIYAIVPNSLQLEFEDRKVNSIIQKDEESFEDKYLNTASFSLYGEGIPSTVFGLFKNKEGNYYCVDNDFYKADNRGLGILFDKGIIDENSLEYFMINNTEDEIHNYFPDEKSAYDAVVSRYGTFDNFSVVEIPLE